MIFLSLFWFCRYFSYCYELNLIKLKKFFLCTAYRWEKRPVSTHTLEFLFCQKEIETCPLEFIKIVIFHVLSEISHLKIKYGIKDGSIVAKITYIHKHTHANRHRH